MKTYAIEIDGHRMMIERDDDGKFIIPDPWRGIGSSLKPAYEPIVLARKALSESSIAANVLRWGTGALNIDACRIHADDAQAGRTRHGGGIVGAGTSYELPDSKDEQPAGRWPANIMTDGSPEIIAAFPDADGGRPVLSRGDSAPIWGQSGHQDFAGYSDSGSAARFFYSSKADKHDRLGSKHPTVKPVDLLQYLCRLITPPKGTILDPFAGTGTTGEAAWREGFNAVLIEREDEYRKDIARRMELCLAGPAERAMESVKARGLDESVLPLFARDAAE